MTSHGWYIKWALPVLLLVPFPVPSHIYLPVRCYWKDGWWLDILSTFLPFPSTSISILSAFKRKKILFDKTRTRILWDRDRGGGNLGRLRDGKESRSYAFTFFSCSYQALKRIFSPIGGWFFMRGWSYERSKRSEGITWPGWMNVRDEDAAVPPTITATTLWKKREMSVQRSTLTFWSLSMLTFVSDWWHHVPRFCQSDRTE